MIKFENLITRIMILDIKIEVKIFSKKTGMNAKGFSPKENKRSQPEGSDRDESTILEPSFCCFEKNGWMNKINRITFLFKSLLLMNWTRTVFF